MTRVPVLVVAALLLVGGCGADTGSDRPAAAGHGAAHRPAAPTGGAKPARLLTVEQLATAVGCQAKVTLKGSDYRQASCSAGGMDVMLFDFATAQGQRAWLDGAEIYGGLYLVGDRWVLSGTSMEYLETARTTLGGVIEGSGQHGS